MEVHGFSPSFASSCAVDSATAAAAASADFLQLEGLAATRVNGLVDESSSTGVVGQSGGAVHDFAASAFTPPGKAEVCCACSELILERTLLAVNDAYWHARCLRCAECSVSLETFPSCFVRDRSIYCKHCYNSRHYGTKCASCERVIQPTDWVRRARSHVYHLACFSCDQCRRQLSTGEEFALQDNRLLCKQHYIELVDGDSGHQKQKTKRVRTTFAEEQLSVLQVKSRDLLQQSVQAHFQVDSNPDGADLERIANMTGLSKRVTQNSRARQKKYQGMKKNSQARVNTDSGRSSEGPNSPKSPNDSSDGMIFPTSVTTSAEEAMVPESRGMPTTLYQFD